MTGTGTQTDPYLIDSYEDFCNISESDKYYKMNCDLDFSKINRRPTEGSITIACKELDGNGHSVSNWCSCVSDITEQNIFLSCNNSIIIKNMNFYGIYLVGGNTSFIQADGFQNIEIINCKIHLIVMCTYNFCGYFKGGSNGHCNITDCEILIEGTSDSLHYLIGGTCTSSLIKYNLVLESTNVGANDVILVSSDRISYSGVTGKIRFKQDNSTSSHPPRFTNNYALCSYFAINIEGLTNNKFMIANSYEGVNFYDKEVMSSLDSIISPNCSEHLYALTTAQCKDANYLKGLGFPCIVAPTTEPTT